MDTSLRTEQGPTGNNERPPTSAYAKEAKRGRKIDINQRNGGHCKRGRENGNQGGISGHSEGGLEGRCPSSSYVCFFLSFFQ
jgi:hypothetical protein